ncbi:integrator complex subunit 6-like [Thomomys bottae]
MADEVNKNLGRPETKEKQVNEDVFIPPPPKRKHIEFLPSENVLENEGEFHNEVVAMEEGEVAVVSHHGYEQLMEEGEGLDEGSLWKRVPSKFMQLAGVSAPLSPMDFVCEHPPGSSGYGPLRKPGGNTVGGEDVSNSFSTSDMEAMDLPAMVSDSSPAGYEEVKEYEKISQLLDKGPGPLEETRELFENAIKEVIRFKC